MSILQENKTRLLTVVAIIAGILLLHLLITSPAVTRQLNEWKLLPQPEEFVELYFTNPNNLPATYAPGQQQTVAFTLHNVSQQPKNLQYVILQQDEAKTISQPLVQQQLTLRPDQTREITHAITPVEAGPRSSISIQLINQNQSIHYWVKK
ncbi:hypothetical protein CYG49_02480 [Candidatus Saccharibacteria bacterium]|nr:MAG: hypothetical protein CYG49_02480 [Candidatus Saccharibacteria bacterium]